ncbi:MAG: Ig-like domain-containing protein, partial [Burkholderiales bacterium]|nr:Ig-like domain-containing protein [Burkholderiales bacterium]
GATQSLQLTGDFADQAGVALPASYVQFTSSDPSVVTVDAHGTVHAVGAGTAIITATANGISAENVITASAQPKAPGTDAQDLLEPAIPDAASRLGTYELSLFPQAVDLAAPTANGGAGQRQIDVHTLTADGSLGTDYSPANAGTQYFVANPAICTVTADGLIVAKGAGTTTITVINGGLQGTIPVRVMAPVQGPAQISAATGGVTQDAVGNTLMIGAGALASDTTASIQALDINSLDLPPPASGVLNTLGAVHVDIGGETSNTPLQLALKVNAPVDPATDVATPLTAGTEVLFWREGTITDAAGVTHKTWWLIDNGVIGNDGLAHTASPPYGGLLYGGNVVITNPKTFLNDKNTGNLKLTGGVLHYQAYWSSLLGIAVAFGTGATIGGGVVGLIAAAAIARASISNVVSFIAYNFAGAYQLNVPSDSVTPDFIKNLSAPPVASGDTTPAITGIDYNPTTRVLKLTGNNFIPAGQSAGNFLTQIWLMPRGDQLSYYTKDNVDRGLVWQGYSVAPNDDGSLQMVLPQGVALSQLDIQVKRWTLTPNSNGYLTTDNEQDSKPIAASTIGTKTTVVLDQNSIDLFAPDTTPPAAGATPNSAPITLLSQLTADENGNALQLAVGGAQDVAYSADGTLAYVAGANSQLYVVDLQTRSVVYTLALKHPSGRIESLLVSGDWLYVAQRDGAQGAGSLSRINVNQLSYSFLKQQQALVLPGVTNTNFISLAVNDNSYLAVTVDGQPYGSVYFLDLNQLSFDGNVKASSYIALNHAAYAMPNEGRNPVYITSGAGSGQFLLCNRGDQDRGLVALTLQFDNSGQINGNTTVTAHAPNLAASVAYKGYGVEVGKTYHEDIQSADSVVLLNYNGEQYAIVSDMNIWFQDLLVTDPNNVPTTQIGGKLGIIENPFGLNGQPAKYLGATTPMVGSAFQKLALGADGTLYATVWNYESNLDLNAPMTYSVLTWNAAQLIQGALQAPQTAGWTTSFPIDRNFPKFFTNGYTTQIPALTPARYDGPAADTSFVNVEGIGGYNAPNTIPSFGLTAVPPPSIELVPWQQPVQLVSNADQYNVNGSLLGKISYFINNAISGGYLERYDARLQQYYSSDPAKHLTYDQLMRANLDDMSTTTGAFVVTAGAAGLTITLVSDSLIGRLLAATFTGGVGGASFEAAKQAGANQIFVDSGGQSGQQGYDWSAIRNATGIGLGVGLTLGALGEVLSAIWGALWSKITPDAQTEKPVSLTPRDTTLDPGYLPETQPTEVPADPVPQDIETGVTVKRNGAIEFVSPGAQSMSFVDAETWYRNQVSKLADLLQNSNHELLPVLAEQAWQTRSDMLEAAKATLWDQNLRDMFGQRHLLQPYKEMLAELQKQYSGDALYKALVTKCCDISGDSCFPAGTGVWTDKGLVPIEEIKVGDMVLSKSEVTGEQAYRPVTQTFVRHDREIWFFYYAVQNTDGVYTGGTGCEPFFATREHP